MRPPLKKADHQTACIYMSLVIYPENLGRRRRGLNRSSSGRRWRVAGVRTGVRALPPRDQHGSLPLAGRIGGEHNLWVVGGLGARGLVYHAWLGSLMARALLSDDETVLPEQLRRWQK